VKNYAQFNIIIVDFIILSLFSLNIIHFISLTPPPHENKRDDKIWLKSCFRWGRGGGGGGGGGVSEIKCIIFNENNDNLMKSIIIILN
jgi:hypothetical protein